MYAIIGLFFISISTISAMGQTPSVNPSNLLSKSISQDRPSCSESSPVLAPTNPALLATLAHELGNSLEPAVSHTKGLRKIASAPILMVDSKKAKEDDRAVAEVGIPAKKLQTDSFNWTQSSYYSLNVSNKYKKEKEEAEILPGTVPQHQSAVTFASRNLSPWAHYDKCIKDLNNTLALYMKPGNYFNDQLNQAPNQREYLRDLLTKTAHTKYGHAMGNYKNLLQSTIQIILNENGFIISPRLTPTPSLSIQEAYPDQEKKASCCVVQ